MNSIEKFVKLDTYYTVTYLARNTGMFYEDVLSYIKRNPKRFKLSYLKSDSGADVYFIRKNCFWKIWDMWNTFRHINYLKGY